ncbi:hypothetical protein OEZ85_012987 [Tetradesmus obliquus]|uniref:Transcription factor CBF/NF-Y/archaeal histone domain-containing protein n=1 Tax=Tetradesmus obliquus TaxID=3088 RepID=A0ABY8U6K9_TETOB|nr:hypothetical protein OEZ85_012987 [Tetradesmus obliquus]
MAEAVQEAAAAAAVADAAPSGGASGKAARDTHGLILPLAKVKRMMREAADVKTISADANFVLTRATELFLQEVAGRAHEVMLQDEQRKSNTLDYKDVAAVVHSWDALDFLHEVVPTKVSAASVLARVQQEQEQKEQQRQQEEQQQGKQQQDDDDDNDDEAGDEQQEAEPEDS